ncbi:WXG100 family type VII secretion target [Streptomyces sp. NPDC057694]|uniref:WXG100 family type VII secretion target n=1 Tax=Streptomyces sp. NPDC057694 TaxID=3346216 RepID=UPI0036A020E5
MSGDYTYEADASRAPLSHTGDFKGDQTVDAVNDAVHAVTSVFGGGGASHSSDFKNHSMNEMQDMLRNANPGDVRNAARGWEGVHSQLVDAAAAYEHAVTEVLQHWEGTSADQFQARSKVVAKKIHDTSTFAIYVSQSMDNAATKLEEIKPVVMAMEKPSEVSSAKDKVGDFFSGGRDEDGLAKDIANTNVSAQEIVDGRGGDMSAGREAQMKMAVQMEELGAAYNTQTKTMGSWKKAGSVTDREDYPGEPGGVAPVPIVAGSVTNPSAGRASGNLSRSSTGSGSGSSIKSVKSPNVSTNGISGGISSQKPTAGSQIGSGNLSFGGGPGAGSGVGAGTGIGAGGGISGGVAGAGAGGSGVGGAGIGGGIGAGAGLGAGAGGRGAGAGAGGRAGMGAGGAGSGAAGKAGANGVKGNSLARTKGGAIGKSVVKPGSGQQGGSALRQKPKTATGGTGNNAGRNGLGGRGAQTNGKDKKRRDSSRPDYLVEDEQTWANDRTVNPKVVE